MTFLRRPRKPVIIDAHRTFSADCWYCRGRLPSSFTTVAKDGRHYRVHLGCRSSAEDLIAGRWIETQPDYGEPRPLDYDKGLPLG